MATIGVGTGLEDSASEARKASPSAPSGGLAEERVTDAACAGASTGAGEEQRLLGVSLRDIG